MKFISWNIDSLNAALTGTSPRAELTRDVLKKIAKEDADIIALQETKLPEAGMNAKQSAAIEELFPDYDCAWISSGPPPISGPCPSFRPPVLCWISSPPKAARSTASGIIPPTASQPARIPSSPPSPSASRSSRAPYDPPEISHRPIGSRVSELET